MATNTYVALKTTTLTSTATSVTLDLTGITGYTDLIVVSSINSARAAQYDSLAVRFNSDTTNNYSYTYMQGNTSNGSTVISGNVPNQSNIFVSNVVSSSVSNNFSVNIMHVMNYANSTSYKTVLSYGGAIIDSSNNDLETVIGLWKKTPEPITSITLRSETGSNFNIGSSFTVYGIANADNFVKATGGIVMEDASYTYHIFGTTATFTPKQALTADVLVLSGGGGGGASQAYYGGGGGGAGGLKLFSSQSLASGTGYVCTVGAGGGNSTNGTASSLIGGAVSISTTAGGKGGSGNGSAGTAGGSGGGGGSNAAGGTGVSGEGFAGGTSSANSNGAGGGGAGAVGANAATAGQGSAGGAGSNAYASWLTLTSFGVSGYVAGGGGGGSYTGYSVASGGAGGGAVGGVAGNGSHALPNTGSGGGGAGNDASTWLGGTGGSGFVIVRYAK